MNKDICIIDYPDEYKSKFVWAHYKLNEELESLLETSGYKDQFKGKYRQRLRHLEERKEKCFLKRDWFEHLKGTEGIYAVKIKGTKNIRVLFIFANVDGAMRAILMTAFEEKTTKDYNPAIVIAEERKKKLLKEDK